MNRRRGGWLLVLFMVLLAATANCAPPNAPASSTIQALALATPDSSTTMPEMTLRYGVAKMPSQLDPHISSDPELSILLNSVYETLVYLNEDYRLEPSLASEWQVSADGLNYTFRLRTGIIFHDGTDFDAQAVKENLERIVDPALGSEKTASLLRGYQGSDILDPHTIRVRFQKPNPTFLDSLAQVYLGMASPTAFKKWGPRDYAMHLVGTGPFRFSETESIPGDTVVLEKNPNYEWGPASYRDNGPRYVGSGHDPNSSCQQTHLVFDHTGPAYLDRAIFKSIPDATARAAALEAGTVDAVDRLSFADAARLQNEGRYWITVVPIPESPFLDDQAGDASNQQKRLEIYRRIQRQTLAEFLRLPVSDHVTFNGANHKVNCLTYDVHGWSPLLYDVTR